MLTRSDLLTATGLTGSDYSSAQRSSFMKSINYQAPVKCSKTITIGAGSEKIWSVLTGINSWPEWQTDISQSELQGALKPQATFTWTSGGAKIHSTLHTVEPGRQLGWTGKTFGIFAVHNWTLTEKNGKTEVAVEESMEGFLAIIFRKWFSKNLEKGMQTWLDLLKKECEK